MTKYLYTTVFTSDLFMTDGIYCYVYMLQGEYPYKVVRSSALKKRNNFAIYIFKFSSFKFLGRFFRIITPAMCWSGQRFTMSHTALVPNHTGQVFKHIFYSPKPICVVSSFNFTLSFTHPPPQITGAPLERHVAGRTRPKISVAGLG